MMNSRCVLLTILSLLLQRQVVGEAIQLTLSNFEEKVDGKSVFIKFFAPWCAHCRAMSEDWDKLADEYEGHPVTLIAKVDCTSDEGQPICQDFDVQGFPTLVYGDPMSAETYDGPRDYDSLSAWAKKHLTKPICSLYKLDNCSEEEKKMVETLQTKTDEDLEAIIANVEAKVKEQEVDFDAKVTVIQKQYDQLVEEFNKNLDRIKDEFHYKYVEQLLELRREDVKVDASNEEL